MATNLTQILNFKVNFHQEFELFFFKKVYANNGGHFKIVSIIKDNYYLFDSYTIWYTRHTCKYIHRIIEKVQKTN